MNTHSQPLSAPDPLEIAVQQVRDRAVPPVPPGLDQATLSLLESRTTAAYSDVQAQPPGSRLSVRWAGAGTLVAAAVIIGIVVFFVGNQTSNGAFAQALDAIEKSDAVKFRLQLTMSGGPPRSHTVFARGPQLRVEGSPLPSSNWIIDETLKGALIVDSKNKVYQTIDMSGGGIAPVSVLNLRIRDELLGLKAQDAKHEGIDEIEGEPSDLYLIPKGKAFHTEGEWRIWISQKSKLPLKVQVKSTLRGVTTDCLYDGFDWNPKTDASTFDIEPPAGYEEKSIFNVHPPLPRRERK